MMTMSSRVVHDNENYAVAVTGSGTGYEVVNKNYNVTEFESISLPECIFAAENLNVVITHETWKWVAKTADSQAEQDRKTAAMSSGLKLIN
jgi:hypothetical protein